MATKKKMELNVIKNVGELITALRQYPTDMAIDVDTESTVAVFNIHPGKGEYFGDKRGYIKIMGVSTK